MVNAREPDLAVATEPPDWQALVVRLAALGSIAGEVGHRFNNLRAVIQGTLALLAADPTGPGVVQRLERIREAAERAQVLAEGVTSVARTQAAADAPFDLGAWLAAAKPWLKQLLGEARELSLEVPQEPLVSSCNTAQLRVAMTALMLNAAAATRPGGRVRVHLGSRPTGAAHEVLLSVADDGIGMTPDVARRATEPFFTTRPHSSGLGLTVAEAFASRHHGRLELTSGPEKGTIVTICLAETD